MTISTFNRTRHLPGEWCGLDFTFPKSVDGLENLRRQLNIACGEVIECLLRALCAERTEFHGMVITRNGSVSIYPELRYSKLVGASKIEVQNSKSKANFGKFKDESSKVACIYTKRTPKEVKGHGGFGETALPSFGRDGSTSRPSISPIPAPTWPATTG